MREGQLFHLKPALRFMSWEAQDPIPTNGTRAHGSGLDLTFKQTISINRWVKTTVIVGTRLISAIIQKDQNGIDLTILKEKNTIMNDSNILFQITPNSRLTIVTKNPFKNQIESTVILIFLCIKIETYQNN